MNRPKPDLTPVHAPTIILRDNRIPPRIGSDVLYVLSKSDTPSNFGRIRPAVVVECQEDGSPNGRVALQVFTNGGIDGLPNVHHVKSCTEDQDEHRDGTWHWPPPRQLVFKAQVQAEPPPELEPEPKQLETAPTEPASEPFVAEPPPAPETKPAALGMPFPDPFSGPKP